MKQHLLRRSTTASFAAVAVSALVLHGSQQALSPPAGTSIDLPSQALTLETAQLAPGETTIACITVTSPVAGSAVTSLRASTLPGSDAVASHGALVTVEALDGAARSCTTATRTEVIFDGPLVERPDALTQQHGDRPSALPTAWSPDHAGQQQTYRVTLALDESAEVTHVTTPPVRLLWDVVPG